MGDLQLARFLAVACLLSFAPAFGQEAAKPTAAPLPGHSAHGETFDEGPRQRAYLMGTTGNIHFPVTTKNPQAQEFVTQGLGQVHGFWYYEAERSFRQAAVLDPDCAMAYWGMAMANINNEKRAKGFIAEAVKRKGPATEREQMYIDALDAYYKAGSGKNKERNTAYTKALEKLLYKHPDDVEARSFLALQLWKNRDGGTAISSYLAIDALLDQIFRANPAHPAHHYRIHLWDHERAENALASAASCGQAAPGIAHMWHMPGHIYSDLKRYVDAVYQQEAGGRVDHAYMIRDRVLPDQIHNYAHNQEWMNRNLNHIGRVRDAVSLARNLIELPQHPKYNTQSKRGSWAQGRQRLFETLTRYELWQEMIELCHTVYLEPTSDEGEQLVRLRHLGRAYFRSGDTTNGQVVAAQIHEQLEKLKAERDKAQATAEEKAKAEKKNDKQVADAKNDAGKSFNGRISNLERAADEMQGYLAQMLGDTKTALAAFQKSALDEQTMAAAMLAAGQAADAEKKARDSVNSHKNEVRPVAMLVHLLWQLDKKDEAAKSFAQLREISEAVDLQSPVFTRLEPIAKELNLPADWRITKPTAADTGVRPPLDSLGPYRWHPYHAERWTLKNAEGSDVSLDHYHGKPVVVIFFLGHGCLHCTQQLQAFAPKVKDFADAGVALVAISTDDQPTLHKSVDAFKPNAVPFPLLTNSTLDVFKSWRCHDDFENQPLHGTFFIDADGYVRWQDISHEPFMDVNFVLQEAKRLLQFPATTNEPPLAGG